NRFGIGTEASDAPGASLRLAAARRSFRFIRRSIRACRLSAWKLAERVGFEPTIRGKPYDDLANRCLQPLGHLSVEATPIVSAVWRQTLTGTPPKKVAGGAPPSP